MRRLLFALLLLALAVSAFWLFLPDRSLVESEGVDSPGTGTPQQTQERPAEPAMPSPADRDSSNESSRRDAPAGEFTVELPVHQSLPEWMGTGSLDHWFEANSAGDYPRRLARARTGDAEAAYWLYQLCTACSSMPRQQWQLEDQQSRIAQALARAATAGNERDGEQLRRRLGHLERAYAFCRVLDPELDLAAEALKWLGRAADLGHMPAQFSYHDQGYDLIAAKPTLAFRDPGLVERFRRRATDYAERLRDSDHPQYRLLLANMYRLGAVYPRDPVKAYAYATAASRSRNEILREQARAVLTLAGRDLHPEQRREAERLAREIRFPGRTREE